MLTELVAVFAFIPWSVPNNNLTHITLPINIANAPHEYTYAFAQGFVLKGQPDADIYTALLPQPDAGPGISVIRAVFEVYLDAAGSTTVDDNCTPHDRGVTCAVNFDGTYDNTYNLEVRNTEGTTWNGMAIDTVTRRRIHIGSFTLPVGTGTTLTSGRGMLVFEGQGGGPPWPHCDEFPHSSVVFGVPATDAGVGSLRDPEEETCKGEDNFKFQRTPDGGIETSIGFPKAANICFQHEEGYSIGNCI